MDTKLQSAKVLTAQEEKNLDSQIESLKNFRDEKEIMQGVTFEASDPEVLDAQIKELERIKRSHGVTPLTAVDRTRALNELKMLEEDLRKDMPTWDEYVSLTPKHGARYTALVRKIVRWEQDAIRRQKIQRWKQLRRLVEPDDPLAASTMYLFPQ